ncbi:hypothetical protein CYK62_11120 [Clostridium perfringens]|uniref:AbiTii domain-containing protein n=1 Tax=Clostridium perfringens TaxID=1502 RepID=UPI000D71B61C|nr:hypothetical protein [Clostridium perfringens]MBO3320263.1 hypothetical protein [Clostridium perfringens]PWX20492.1 hypothetical protein CYK62_11120 [Clostridium perfringens]
MARSKLIRDFITSQMDIDTALQNLIAILYCLDNEVLINWAKKELEGYDSSDELPNYRKLKGRVMASFLVGSAQYSKRQFGISHLDEEFKDKLLKLNIYSSISTLIGILDKDVTIGKSIEPEIYPLLQSNSNAYITNASVDADMCKINDIISKVKTRILETLLLLEKEFGNLDELDIDISIKSEKELESIIRNIQVTLYDNSISIGDNNKIKNSDIVTNK